MAQGILVLLTMPVWNSFKNMVLGEGREMTNIGGLFLLGLNYRPKLGLREERVSIFLATQCRAELPQHGQLRQWKKEWEQALAQTQQTSLTVLTRFSSFLKINMSPFAVCPYDIFQRF